jgi:hypothetical protein
MIIFHHPKKSAKKKKINYLILFKLGLILYFFYLTLIYQVKININNKMKDNLQAKELNLIK